MKPKKLKRNAKNESARRKNYGEKNKPNGIQIMKAHRENEISHLRTNNSVPRKLTLWNIMHRRDESMLSMFRSCNHCSKKKHASNFYCTIIILICLLFCYGLTRCLVQPDDPRASICRYWSPVSLR
mmetsp:Transcript_7299/g.17204  ORF Transcript_7299/g.17204 Transcript_7299/m.17204 type:complete len:126 (-) Transcript_7299:708-1085(-)